MEIIKIKIADLTPYENNAKKHPKKQIEEIKNSIKKFGFCDPVGIWGEKNIIVEGHGRVLALQEMGETEVECIRLDHLTDDERKAYTLAHNQTTLSSDFDFEKLEAELGELAAADLDFSMADFGFDLSEFEEPQEIVEDEPPEVDEDSEPITQLGDIWQLGDHRLMCGDSTDALNINILMNGKKADMILSDPPYGMCLDTDFSGAVGSLGRKGGTRGNKYDKIIGDNDDFKPELISTFFDNFGYCKEVFLFGADYFAELLPNKNDGAWLCWDKRKESQADAIGSEFELIWSKNKHKRRMLRHDWFGFLSSQNAKDAQHRVHPTQKPVTLLVDIINQWGNGCNIIVDLYGGSGSTLIACEQLNRVCYMCELEPKYCDVIVKRWETLTGKKAVKIN